MPHYACPSCRASLTIAKDRPCVFCPECGHEMTYGSAPGTSTTQDYARQEKEPVEVEIEEEYGPRPLMQRFDIWFNNMISGCLLMLGLLAAYFIVSHFILGW